MIFDFLKKSVDFPQSMENHVENSRMAQVLFS